MCLCVCLCVFIFCWWKCFHTLWWILIIITGIHHHHHHHKLTITTRYDEYLYAKIEFINLNKKKWKWKSKIQAKSDKCWWIIYKIMILMTTTIMISMTTMMMVNIFCSRWKKNEKRKCMMDVQQTSACFCCWCVLFCFFSYLWKLNDETLLVAIYNIPWNG